MQSNLGKILKDYRKQHGYSQEYVASKLNIIRQTYSHYETGRVMPSIESLYLLAELYHIPICSFFGAMSEEEPCTEDSCVAEDKCIYKTSSTQVLSANELELLSYYRQFNASDKLDILDFMIVKAKRIKNKKS